MAPIKKKYVRGNTMPFFNKELSGAHKKRTQLRNRFLKKRSNQNKKLYSKQRNFCFSLLRKTKRRHYANLNHKDIADNNQFWKTVKRLLSDKSKSNEKIILVEDNENLVKLILLQKIFFILFSKRYLNMKTIQVSLLFKMQKGGQVFISLK